MQKFQSILCPTDFSDLSGKAYSYAVSLAAHYKANLLLEHVVQPLGLAYPYYNFPGSFNEIYSQVREQAEHQLREFAKGHALDGVLAEAAVVEGSVPEAILDLAEKHAVDLIVMGTHGRHGIDRLVVGSVAEKVMRKAHCAVLVVRKPMRDFLKPARGEDPIDLRRLVVCNDFSEHSRRALGWGLSLAREYKAELTQVHVLESLPENVDLAAETTRLTRLLEKPLPADARHDIKIKTVVRVGHPYQQIIQLAVETQADLVVLGVRGRNAADLALFGSTSYRVIQLGPCPVLVVHI